MALELEDGTGKSNAQSYASVAVLKAYARLRGATLPAGDTECERLLIKAMDRMNGLNYIGERCTKEQALDWPRYNVCIDGFGFESTDLPRQLEQAQCAFAIEALSTDLMPTTQANAPGSVVEETVGPVTLRYSNDGRRNSVPAVAKAEALLRVLLRRNGLTAIRS